MSYSYPEDRSPAVAQPREGAREVEALLWVAAGAAWALVALKAWSQTRRSDARRRTLSVSDRLLHQVFPNGLRT